MNSIGHKLKTLRKGRKLTQEQAADLLGITRATVSNYEVGRRSPHISELKRIADFYGVGLDYFGIVPTDEVFDLLSREEKSLITPPYQKKRKTKFIEN